MALVDEIRAEASRQKLTQKDLATLLGKKAPTISAQLKPDNEMQLGTAREYARILGIPLSELIARDETRNKQVNK